MPYSKNNIELTEEQRNRYREYGLRYYYLHRRKLNKAKAKKLTKPANYSWDRCNKRWKVYVGIDWKDKHCCYCKTKAEAKRAARYWREYYSPKNPGPSLKPIPKSFAQYAREKKLKRLKKKYQELREGAPVKIRGKIYSPTKEIQINIDASVVKVNKVKVSVIPHEHLPDAKTRSVITFKANDDYDVIYKSHSPAKYNPKANQEFKDYQRDLFLEMLW